MKTLSLLSSVSLILFVVSSCTTKQAPNRIEVKLDSVFATAPDFSGVVLLADQGKPLYYKAFGFKDFNTNSEMDTTAIFELASVSKQFTAMTIMLLAEEGKLSYDDPVNKYIPGLPYEGITIRHLLTHTSGLPDYQAIMDQYWDKTKVAGNKENIEYLTRYHPPILFKPGDRYEYSNTGYMLLASVTEKASGQDFIAFCRARIFVPLRMTSTDIRTLDEKMRLKNMTWGHVFVPEKQLYMRTDSFPKNNYAIWLGNRTGPGRVSSTARDLLKWDRALYGESIVKQATLSEAFTPFRLLNDGLSNYGFGWTLQTDKALGKIVRHSGSNPGYSTHIVRYIDADNTIILLCNNEHKKFNDILQGIEAVLTTEVK